MNLFETHLINDGLHFKTAARHAKVAAKYTQWLAENSLNVENIKRSQFTDWLQTYREQGLEQDTINGKESVIRKYYYFLGTSENPAKSWIERKDEHKLPPVPIEKSDLMKLYESWKPKSRADYRNRCMLGFIVFQGLKRIELEEMQISDVNFDKCNVFIRSQRKSNSRWLKLEPAQILHLHDYFRKHRRKLLRKKNTDTDKFFLSSGRSKNLEGVFCRILEQVKKFNPKIINLYHIRTSVISRWLNEDGLVEAMINAGHLNIGTTERYETKKYDNLKELLKTKHPMEQLDFTL